MIQQTTASRELATRFLDFVHTYHNPPLDFSETPFDESIFGIRGQEVTPPTYSRFNARYDTYVYGELLRKAITINGAPKSLRLYDLGAGSSIPSLMALSSYPKAQIKVTAVEIDEDAITVSQNNARQALFLDRYEFLKLSIFHFLASAHNLPSDLPIIIGANPPYVPCPENDNDQLLTINGGPDGNLFLDAIMDTEFPKGTLLALQWSSMTSPNAMIEKISNRFIVKYLMGTYVKSRSTKSPDDLNPHLKDMYLRGESLIFLDRGPGVQYMIVGTVLEKK